MPQTRFHGFPVVSEDFDVSAAKVLLNGSYFELKDTVAAFTAFGRSLVDDANASDARTTLGLGSIATQAASNVTITGGSVTGTTGFAHTGTGAVTRTWAKKLHEIVSVLDYIPESEHAAIQNQSSTTDVATYFQAAMDAVPDAGILFIPKGKYRLIGSGSAILAVRTNYTIRMVGEGASSILEVGSSVPNTRDVIAVTPTVGTAGNAFKDFFIKMQSGAAGRHGIHIDTQSGSSSSYYTLIDNVWCEPTSGGNSIKHTSAVTNATGGLFYSRISNCALESVELVYTGDSIEFENNVVVSSSSTIPTFKVSQISGAGGLCVRHNTFVGKAGMVIVDSGVGPRISNNTFEQIVENTEANNAIINITGATANVWHPVITDNQIQVISSVTGTCSAIRIASATTPSIDRNRISIRGSNKHVVLTTAVRDTYIGNSNQYVTDDVIGGLALTDTTPGTTRTVSVTQAPGTGGGLVFSGSAGFYFQTGAFPSVSNTYPLGGSGSLEWGDLFLGNGAVIGFNSANYTMTHSSEMLTVSGGFKSASAALGIGYATGAGGTVTQVTSRTTGVTLNKTTGAITLVSAAGSTTAASFTVTNTSVAATDVIILNQKSGTDKYDLSVTAVGSGSFEITFKTHSGTTTEQPVFSFAVIKGVTA